VLGGLLGDWLMPLRAKLRILFPKWVGARYPRSLEAAVVRWLSRLAFCAAWRTNPVSAVATVPGVYVMCHVRVSTHTLGSMRVAVS
jgi:hypothetical protein